MWRRHDFSSLPSENILPKHSRVVQWCSHSGATVETEASEERKLTHALLPLCRSTVETDASEGKMGAMVLPLWINSGNWGFERKVKWCSPLQEPSRWTDASEEMLEQWCSYSVEQPGRCLRSRGEGKHSKLLTNLERGNMNQWMLQRGFSEALIHLPRGCENRRQRLDEKASRVQTDKGNTLRLTPHVIILYKSSLQDIIVTDSFN